MYKRLLALLLLLFPILLFAATDGGTPIPVAPESQTSGTADPAKISWESIRTLAYLIAFMTFAVLGAAVLLITKTSYAWTPYSVIRLLGLILILMIALFLAVVPVIDAKTHIQVIGLLGTIGGYLLGKESRELDVNQQKKPKTKAEKPHKLKGAQRLPVKS